MSLHYETVAKQEQTYREEVCAERDRLRKQIEQLRYALKTLLSSAGTGSLSRATAEARAKTAITATDPERNQP